MIRNNSVVGDRSFLLISSSWHCRSAMVSLLLATPMVANDTAVDIKLGSFTTLWFVVFSSKEYYGTV